MSHKSFTTKNEFLTAVGVVNAHVVHVRTGLLFSTKYTGVADRIVSMARSINAKVLRTYTDDFTIVISVKGFYRSREETRVL